MGQHAGACCNGHCSVHDKKKNRQWIRLFVTAVIWLSCWILQTESSLPVSSGLWCLGFVAAWIPVALPVIVEAWEAVKKKDFFNEFTLMLLASCGAFYIGEYPEAVAVMLFYALGEILQEQAVDKARGHIRSLMDVRPRLAAVVDVSGVRMVAPEGVHVGCEIEVKTGERVPLDGVLLTEGTFFNTAALTGESVPQYVGKGEEVLAGMIPTEGVVYLQVVREYSDSTLSRILDMVQDAVSRKAPAERFIRKFARIYTPCVTILAVALVCIPWIYSLCTEVFVFDFDTWFYRALVFLVLSCPCALVVSIPLSYFGGIGAASRIGVLFKGGNYLDEMARVNTMVFDKTGTLTKGVFRVQNVLSEKNVAEVELLSILAGAEQWSTHPVARAIVGYVHEQGAVAATLTDVTELAGLGIHARSESGEDVLVGKPAWLQASGVSCPSEISMVPETVVAVSVGGCYFGCVLLADEPREDAFRLSAGLHALGVDKQYILSGDKQALVRKLAETLGMTCSYGDLMPEDKVRHVEELQSDKKNVVAFVGDGLNDAPVLAVSRIGIAMGGLGSDVAIETADVVLQTDQLSKLVDAIHLGRRTRTVVWQNILLAFGIKLVVLLLGALGMAALWEAVFADVGVTLLAVLNTLRLLNLKVLSEK